MRGSVKALLATAAVVTGCARQAATASTPASSEPPVREVTEWNGQFRPMQQSQSQMGMAVKQNVFGTVRVVFRDATNRSHVALTINTSLSQSEVLAWSIAPGRCGSGSIPLMPAAQFPAIEISNTGRGELSINELAVALPTGSYHVNVYRGGETLSAVIACANLARR